MFRRTWLAAVAFVLAFAGTDLVGQVVANKQNVVMVMRVPGELSAAQLRIYLERPKRDKKYLGQHDWQAVKLTRIAKDTYDIVKRLSATGLVPIEADEKSASIRRINDTTLFEIRFTNDLKQRGVRLARLSLYFGEKKDRRTIIDPMKKSDEDLLEFLTVGVYRLKYDAKTEPRSCVISVLDPTTGREVDLREQPWPGRADGYWMIELTNFTGSLTSLFDGLRDEEVMPAPFHDIVDARATTLVIGSMTPGSTNDDGFQPDKNEYLVRVAPPGGRSASRIKNAWVLFPVTAEQRAKLLAEYRDPSLTDEQLVSRIIQEGVSYSSASSPSELRPDMRPTWYQIPRGADGRFERNFRIEDLQGWKQKSNGSMHRLVVYQFDSSTPSAVPVIDPCDKEGKKFNYVTSREVTQWPAGIRLIADGLPKCPE